MNNSNMGLILLNLNGIQSENTLSQISNMTSKRPDINFVIFNSYNNTSTSNIPIFHINQCKFFRGDLITFDIIGLMLAVSSYYAKNIYYYANDTPWIMDSSTDFSFWENLFDDNRVKIIAQNQEISTIYSKIWKKPIAISGDLNTHEFCKIL